MKIPPSHQDSPRHTDWLARVKQLEIEGLDRSDAQGIADMEEEQDEGHSIDKLECKTQRKTFICSHCKSENIWFDAIMAWNKEKQEFQLEDFGKAFCNDCQGETTDKEITL